MSDWNLVVSLLVHEDIVLTLLVKVLVGAALHAHVFKLLADVEAALQHTAVHNVLQLYTHESVTLTRLYMKKVDDEEQFAIHTDACSHLDVL